MIDFILIKKAFYNNFINTSLIIIVFYTLNSKMDLMLIREGIHDTKLEQLDKASSEHESIVRRINKLETSFAAHIGEAYLRKEDDLIKTIKK